MDKAVLQRTYQDTLVTFGQLTLPDYGIQIATLELPWRDNQSNISCIPSGQYPLVPVYSNKFGHVLWVQEVPGRTVIRVHAGNTTRDTHGCIITGKSTGTWKGQPFIFNSRAALRQLLRVVTKPFYLEVNNVRTAN